MHAAIPSLKRTLTLPLVIGYGLGTILGAGIYVLIAAVTLRAGTFMPAAFIVAGIVAAFSAFSFAALGARFPHSGGEAVYIDEAFGIPLMTRLIGIGVVLIGIVSSATIAKGFAGYLNTFIPVSDVITSGALVIGLGVVAAIGISLSVWVATLITLIEAAGLIFIVVITAPNWLLVVKTPTTIIPGFDAHSWSLTLTGAFLAFYAFLGFEDMVNIAEEIKDPERVLPQAIIAALVIATVLYFFFTLSIIATLPVEQIAQDPAPLATLVESIGINPTAIAVISMLAIVNGALVQIIKGSRVVFGLAKRTLLPKWFCAISAKTQTPINGTIFVTSMTLLLVSSLPIERLASITSSLTLVVFSIVNISLWVIQHREREKPALFCVPQWVPITGALLCLGLLVFDIFKH